MTGVRDTNGRDVEQGAACAGFRIETLECPVRLPRLSAHACGELSLLSFPRFSNRPRSAPQCRTRTPCSARSAAFRSPPAHRPTAPCLAIPMSTDTATPVPRYRPYVAAFHDSTPQAMATLAPTPPRRTAGGVRSAGEDHTRAAASTSAADAERMETAELISELAAVFRSTEDVELIDALAALDAQVRQTGEQRSAALKQTLRALSTRVEQARERATPTEPEDAHAQRLEGREREKQEVIAQIMTAEENTRASRANCRAHRHPQPEARPQPLRHHQQHSVELPLRRHASARLCGSRARQRRAAVPLRARRSGAGG
eukprot:ctg_807.g419